MDKLQMAHDWAMKALDEWYVTNTDDLVDAAWIYADAMYAEMDKRKPSGLPEALRSEVDWRIAPGWAKYWAIRDSSSALWCTSKPTCTDDLLISHGPCSPAPSFGFTGSHIVERPHDL